MSPLVSESEFEFPGWILLRLQTSLLGLLCLGFEWVLLLLLPQVLVEVDVELFSEGHLVNFVLGDVSALPG